MHKAWNKGYTKNTHPSVKKISETMKTKRINNFSRWRERMLKEGKIRSPRKHLSKNADLAELIGVVLGDGNISPHIRTEALCIVGNSENNSFIKRYEKIVNRVFGKMPSVRKKKDCNATRITMYEKDIGRRLGIPTGSKKNLEYVVPDWIMDSQFYIRCFLRGLYEADGSFSIHKPTCTYKFVFSNYNESLLNNVYNLLKILGLHPHIGKGRVQISRKNEVFRAKKLIGFRNYGAE